MASTSAAAANATQSEYFFGWNLLFRTVEKDMNKKADILVILLHFVLVKHYKLRCVGVGEDKTISEQDEVEGSELIPNGWNDDNKKYAMRYLYNGQLYLLLGHITEECLILNLLDVKTNKVSNIALNPEELVKQFKGPLTEVMPCAAQLANRFSKELVDPVFAGTAKEVCTQTTIEDDPRQRRDRDPLAIGEPRRPMGQFNPDGFPEPRPFGFPEIGRSDLDPLGRIGAGNLFPFPSHPDFRGGGVQPRFDPYGPTPDRNNRGNPTPDHLRPPSFGDYFS